MGTRDTRGRKLLADLTQFSDYFFRCHGNGLHGTSQADGRHSPQAEKNWSIDLVPGKPGTTQSDAFVSEPLSWFRATHRPWACSTSQCCHPLRGWTYSARKLSFCMAQNSTNFEQAEATSSASLLKLSPRSGTSRWLACLLDNSSFVIVPTCDTPIFYDTIIYFPSKNIPEIQKTGTMSLLNDFQGIRSRILKE